MKTYEFKPKNICAMKITFAIEEGKIFNLKFHGGCNGNAKGIANLLEGKDAKEAVRRLENVNCGNRGTSCPAQLAEALTLALNE